MRLVSNTGILFLLAAFVSGCAPKSEKEGADKPSAGAPAPAVAALEPVDGLPVLAGDDRSLVTVIAFVDYACPFCAKADRTVAALAEFYRGDLRVVIASHPLPMHERARPMALAALAASDQGAFAPMHARLFEMDGRADDARLDLEARALGLDAARFDEARRGRAVLELERAEALARDLGVTGTPTFFVDGRRIDGAQPREVFRAVIDDELRRAHAFLAAGTRPRDLYGRLVATAPAAPPPARHDEPANHVQTVAVGRSPARGPEDAPVTIVTFMDLECPYSAKFAERLGDVERAFAGKVRVVYKAHPLPMHANARLEARFAAAAHAQGKFWAARDVLLAEAANDSNMAALAARAGLDVPRLLADMGREETLAALRADEAQGEALGVTGTPTTFVNGWRLIGARPQSELNAAVERALAEAR